MGNEEISLNRFIQATSRATLLFLSTSIGWGKEIKPVDPDGLPFLFVHENTCNSYLIRSGDACLIIDWGTGGFLPHLNGLGINKVERVLFTHHHREQLQGAGLIDRSTAKVWAPAKERDFFEKPASFRKWWPKLGDKFSVYGASYLRPPAYPIALDRVLEDGESFDWKGFRFTGISTPGHSPGHMAYLLERDAKTIAFTGGHFHDEAKLSTWFDSEWDYGFGKGIDALLESTDKLIANKPTLAFPSHGSPIARATRQLETFKEKLTVFRASYVRGYPVHKMKPAEADGYSKPTKFPLMNRVTPHLYKLNPKTLGKNFSIIISDNGRGLILDSGLFPELLLHRLIQGMKEHFGLKRIDALWISHMHGDHFLHARILKEKYGVKTWTLDRIADKCENPRRYDYAALVSAYGDGFDGVSIDKPFKTGESVEWEGYKIQVDWMPGQTEFGCCLWLEIDGKKIAFTGDNLFADSSNPEQNGHEAVVARNSSIFEEGYLLGSRYLKELAPDIVMGAHSYVMPEPVGLLHRYHEWSKEIIRLYKDLLPETDYEYLYDPYWVSAYPYRVDFSQKETQSVEVTVRNFRSNEQSHEITLVTPAGITADPPVLRGKIPAEQRATYRVNLRIDRTKAQKGLGIIPFDVTLDGKHKGQWFDFIYRTNAGGDEGR
jgi:glyoxylase-like metal-dependent hydrolase (beta-lactamase superfamily II)